MPHFWAKSLPYSLQPRRLQRPPAGFIFAKRPLPTAFWPAPNLERPNYWPFWTLMAISSRNFLYNRAIFKMRLGKFVGLGKGYQGKEFLVVSHSTFFVTSNNYFLDVLCHQQIKLFQVVSTSEFHEYWWNHIVFDRENFSWSIQSENWGSIK